jgi:hypothetical protein
MPFFLKFVYSLAKGNTVCGNMSGQHLYVPVDATAVVDPVRLFAFVGNSGAGYRSDTQGQGHVIHLGTGYRSDIQEQDTCQILRNRIQVRDPGSESRNSLRNRIQVSHSGAEYRSDTQGRRHVKHSGTG